MISNSSGHHNNSTGARTPGSAPSRSGARLLLHTAAALSFAGDRPARESRSRGKKRTAVPFRAQCSVPAAGRQQRGKQVCHDGVRVRAPAGAAQTAGDDGPSCHKRLASRLARQKNKDDTTARSRPAGGRTGSTPASGSESRRRRAGALVFDDRNRDQAPRRRSDNNSLACTRETAVPLYQHNFTRIKEDPGGCYRQAEEVTLQGDQAQALPIGNRSHPFTGSFDSEGHRLIVNLTHSQGDAVLFDTIDHSRIRLTMHKSWLETRNGSRAALIGTMKADNQVVIRRMTNSVFKARGEGTVEAALVARTTGSGNRLDIESAEGGEFFAQSLPGAGKSRALASLGLGVIAAPGVQHINQIFIWGNLVQARVCEPLSGGKPERARPDSGAFAALLGFLDARVTAAQDLTSRQNQIQGAVVEALVEGASSDARSCASLGYASVDCGRQDAAESWTGRLRVSQAHVVYSLVRARVDGRSDATGAADRRPQAGLARATLVSTGPVSRLHLLHQLVASDQLEAEAGTVQLALLPPTRKASVLLLSGGDSRLPLFGSWGGPHNCSVINGPVPGSRQPGTSLVDSAGYAMASFNCASHAAARALVVDSRQPDDWRWAQALFSDFVRSFTGRPVLAGVDNSLHYPDERVQSLITGADGQWLLVTRQYYSWQAENTAGGLLRVTRYLPSDNREALPQSLPPSRPGFSLHPPEAGDLPLQGSTPVHSLVHHGRLFQLYQQQGQPAQLVSLSSLNTDTPYRLAQYDALPGRARLLSVEGAAQLHLWMQQDDHNILQVYGLGADAPLTNRSAWLHRVFDLSDQPGGQALLARDGDWLYSLRQSHKRPTSLRRFAISTGKMDTAWQRTSPGSVSEILSLVVARERLVAVYPGALPDPAVQDGCHMLIAHALGWGGPLEWAGMGSPLCHLLPAESDPGVLPADSSADSRSTPATAAGEEHKTFLGISGAVLGAAAVPALVTLGACCGGVLSLWLCQRRKPRVAPGPEAALQEGHRVRPGAMNRQTLRLGRRI